MWPPMLCYVPTLEQNIELAITKIFKNNPQTGTMEHQQLVKYLEKELKKLGFDDLDNVNILKYATLIRDPFTMEITVPFDTRPSKTDEARNLAWNKTHQEAFGR